MPFGTKKKNAKGVLHETFYKNVRNVHIGIIYKCNLFTVRMKISLDSSLCDSSWLRLICCKTIEGSTEFVIKVGAGTDAVGLFESIHLFVYKLMLQNAISGVKRRAHLCLEQNGELFQPCVVTLFNKINITIVIFLLIPRILNSSFSLLQLSLNATFVAIVQN
jgi:hypothetical protein